MSDREFCKKDEQLFCACLERLFVLTSPLPPILYDPFHFLGIECSQDKLMITAVQTIIVHACTTLATFYEKPKVHVVVSGLFVIEINIQKSTKLDLVRVVTYW